MSISKQYNRIIRKELRVHAAWFPIVNVYTIGDYGIIENGLFVRRGNIKKDFGVSLDVLDSPDASINFKSTSTTIIKLDGGVPVQTIPATSITAQVKVQFSRTKSFLIKSPSIKVKAIASPNTVAQTLAAHPTWRPNYKVVYEIYFAKKAIVISTKDSNTELVFSGNATALENLDLGNVNLNMSFTKAVGLDIQGKEGVLGLGLFQVSNGGMDAVRGAKKPVKVTAVKVSEMELADDL